MSSPVPSRWLDQPRCAVPPRLMAPASCPNAPSRSHSGCSCRPATPPTPCTCTWAHSSGLPAPWEPRGGGSPAAAEGAPGWPGRAARRGDGTDQVRAPSPRPSSGCLSPSAPARWAGLPQAACCRDGLTAAPRRHRGCPTRRSPGLARAPIRRSPRPPRAAGRSPERQKCKRNLRKG